MHDTAVIENQQQRQYPGLRVRREGDAVVVHIPARFRRRNGRFMILTDSAPAPNSGDQPSGGTSGGGGGGNQTLIETIAKAYRWQEQLEAGEFAGIDDLTRALNLDRSYVQRLLRLTSLAPDIVEAILRGDEPNGISLKRLHKSLPLRWAQQRTQFSQS